MWWSVRRIRPTLFKFVYYVFQEICQFAKFSVVTRWEQGMVVFHININLILFTQEGSSIMFESFTFKKKMKILFQLITDWQTLKFLGVLSDLLFSIGSLWFVTLKRVKLVLSRAGNKNIYVSICSFCNWNTYFFPSTSWRVSVEGFSQRPEYTLPKLKEIDPQISSLCTMYRQQEETFNHLFIGCSK